nr:hypothetical protein CFP56_72994 [Quercus suber]
MAAQVNLKLCRDLYVVKSRHCCLALHNLTWALLPNGLCGILRSTSQDILRQGSGRLIEERIVKLPIVLLSFVDVWKLIHAAGVRIRTRV